MREKGISMKYDSAPSCCWFCPCATAEEHKTQICISTAPLQPQLRGQRSPLQQFLFYCAGAQIRHTNAAALMSLTKHGRPYSWQRWDLITRQTLKKATSLPGNRKETINPTACLHQVWIKEVSRNLRVGFQVFIFSHPLILQGPKIKKRTKQNRRVVIKWRGVTFAHGTYTRVAICSSQHLLKVSLLPYLTVPSLQHPVGKQRQFMRSGRRVVNVTSCQRHHRGLSLRQQRPTPTLQTVCVCVCTHTKPHTFKKDSFE